MFKLTGIPHELKALLIEQDHQAPLWVVGGAVRDALLQRETDDVDFTTPGDAIALARTVANRLGGDMYVLDPERGAGRVLYSDGMGRHHTFDFAQLRGETLEADLQARDFTINAMALRISALGELIDPCGGAQHLIERQLALCSQDALVRDPVRTLRAVRIATEYSLHIQTQVVEAIRSAPSFATVSAERVRDELFNILAIDEPASALSVLDYLGVLGEVLPPAYRQLDGSGRPVGAGARFAPSLRSLHCLSDTLAALRPGGDQDRVAQATLGLLVWTLGRYRDELSEHLFEVLPGQHRRRELLLWAHLFEPLIPPAKGAAKDAHIEDDAKAFSHPGFEHLGEHFRLSGAETEWAKRWAAGVQNYSKVSTSSVSPDLSVHRYFRKTGDAGVSVVLSSLAHVLADEIGPPATDRWAEQLEAARVLFNGWFEEYERLVAPPHLIDGKDVMQILDIPPGPDVGRFLDLVRESQVSGEVSTIADALEFLQGLRLR